MPETAICLDDQTLKDFLLGRLPPEQAGAAAAHLEECSRCVALARTQEPADPLVTALRQARIITRTPLPPVITNLMESMRRLRPRAVTQTVVTENRGFLAPPRTVGELGWLGTYRILRELGSGGMGIVYLAEDQQLQRQVAIKVMQTDLAVHPIARERFLREARAAAALDNDHVVTIHQVGEDNGVPYMVMPLLQGETLAARLLRERLLSVADTIRIGRETAIGLSAAHEKGLVHRDVKPANIWLDSTAGGRVKLLDFGLAWAEEHTPVTPQEVLIGTPAYLAPEMVRGETVDARSDLFSLGCVLYEMLTGRLAFGGAAGDSHAILKALARDVPPPPPRTLNPDVPAWLSDLVLQLLAKTRESRPESARAVLTELSQSLATVPPTERIKTPQFASQKTSPGGPRPSSTSTVPGIAEVDPTGTLVEGLNHPHRQTPPIQNVKRRTSVVVPPPPPVPRSDPKPPSPSTSGSGRRLPTTPEEFCELFARSRLAPADEVQAGYKRWRKAFPRAAGDMDHLARWLAENDYLTEYQASLLKRGHVNHFYLNQYKILDRIGVGRMAGVYKAVHQLGQQVAIKVLPPSMARDKVMLGRFHREARLAMKLKHPNIVRTFDVGVAGEKRHQYLVMEYLEGEPLSDTLAKRGKLSPQEAARLVYQALLGLQHIHEQGMVHRDVKPANLMMVPSGDTRQPKKGSQATVKILDIGLGRGFFDECDTGDLTRGDAALGTPAYMAPEQARDSHTVDIRADIYSIGCTLYHCLAGQPPFPTDNAVLLLKQQATEKPRPVREFNPEVPDALQQVLDTMLAKDPALRYPTPERAAQALQPFLTENYQPTQQKTEKLMTYEQWLEEADRRGSTVDIGNLPPPQPWDSGASFPRSMRSSRSSSTLNQIVEPPPPPPLIPPWWIAVGFGIAFVSLIVGGVLAWVMARH